MVITIPQNILEYIADRQKEFQTAWNILQYIFTIFAFETFAMILCEKIGLHGPVAMVIYVILPATGFIGVILVGQILIRSNYQYLFMKKSADINYDWKEVVETLRYLKEKHP